MSEFTQQIQHSELQHLGYPFQLQHIESVWFNNKTIHLAGYRFVRCRFDGCTLVIANDDFSLEKCYLGPDNVIQFAHESVKLIQLLNRDKLGVSERNPKLSSEKHPDGTISIQGADKGRQN